MSGVDMLILIALGAVIVAVFIIAGWNLSVTLEREVRHGRMLAARHEREAEDRAWAEHLEQRGAAHR